MVILYQNVVIDLMVVYRVQGDWLSVIFFYTTNNKDDYAFFSSKYKSVL